MANAAVLPFPQPAAPPSAPPELEDDGNYLPVEKLRRQYLDYLGAKSAEIEEQKDARRYYHGSQWTAAEIATLKKRHQPVVTFNRIVRKLDAVVGLVERLKQSPKSYARTPDNQAGADLATASIRYVLDASDWKSKRPRTAHFAATDGIAGLEYDLEAGDQGGDPDLRLHIVYPDTFFYDPRSYDEGFTDARFMGVSKWVDVDQAKEICPGNDQEIDDLVESGTDLTTNSDREMMWVNTTLKRVRLIDHWYIRGGKWRWCLYINNVKMMEGMSPFKDERGKTFPKYRMFSASVDQDGDRYGFVRNLKSPQDELNHRRSKSLHLLNSRRIIATKGAVDDVEKARAEYAKSDGWIEKNPSAEIVADDQRAMADMRAHAELMKDAKDEIENFGPNPALIGQGLEDSSGRAIALLQQAGMAELGPYLSAFKNWETRVYRDIFDIISAHWKAERWLRVTDDAGLAQFFKINQQTIDQFGRPAVINAIGSLDVDFILDEGPDTINMQADAYGVLQSLGPQFVQEFPDIAIDLAPLENGVKKKMQDKIKQKQSEPPPPDPKVEAMKAQMQMDMQMRAAEMQADQQKQQADLEFQQRKAASDAQLKREQADSDAALKRDIAAAEMQLEREKAAAEIEIEQAKSNNQMQVERTKTDHAARLNRDVARSKMSEGETDEMPGNDEPAPAEQRHSESLSAMEMLARAVTAPKQVEVLRDAKTGAITGARVV